MADVYADAHIEAARIVGRSAELRSLSQSVDRSVLTQAARHRDTGRYMRSVDTKAVVGPSGVTDYVTYTNDPAALSIEYGHHVIRGSRGGRRASLDPGARVPGQYVFTKAFKAL